MKKISIFLFLFCFLAYGRSYADPFRFFGARPAGMGGAYVAVAEGSLAQYWNPAGLGLRDSGFDLHLPEVGAAVEVTKDTLEKAEKISDLADTIDRIQSKRSAATMNMDDYNDFIKILDAVNSFSSSSGLGVVGTLFGGVDLKGWTFGISLNNYIDFSASPFVDLENIKLASGVTSVPSGPVTSDPSDTSLITSRNDLKDVLSDLGTRSIIDLGALSAQEAANAVINDSIAKGESAATVKDNINNIKNTHNSIKSSLPTATGDIKDNKTSLIVRGASITELSIGLGGDVPFSDNLSMLSNVLVGINMKALQAKVGYGRFNVLDSDADLKDVVDDMQNNTKTSNKLSLDIGLLYDKKKDWGLRTGIVFKNITSPSFRYPSDDPSTSKIEGEERVFKMNRQIRAGAAYWLLDRWVFALDIDITKNKTALPDYSSRILSFGTEFKLLDSRTIDLAVRAGVFKNIAETKSALSYTSGLGITLLHVNLDISGGMSSSSQKTGSGSSIPSSLNINAALSITF